MMALHMNIAYGYRPVDRPRQKGPTRQPRHNHPIPNFLGMHCLYIHHHIDLPYFVYQTLGLGGDRDNIQNYALTSMILLRPIKVT